MRKRYTLGMVTAVGLAFVLACITVNIYFPEAAVKQAADQIENDIQKKAAEKAGQEPIKKICHPAAEGPLHPRPGGLRPRGDDGLEPGHPGAQGRQRGEPARR